MKAKIIENVTVFEGELEKGEILDIITIAIDPDDSGLDVILERNGKAYDAYFKDLHDANEHIRFNYSDRIESLEKQIDLMSEQLTTPIHNKEWVRQYYENKAKE